MMYFFFSDLCIGNSMNNRSNIIPCTWVGLNASGDAEIKNGNLYVNGLRIWKLSEIRPLQQNEAEAPNVTADSFHMEPLRTLFVSIRICYEGGMLCSFKFLGTVTMVTDNTKSLTSEDGSAISATVSAGGGGGGAIGKRAATSFTVETPAGINMKYRKL